MRIAGLNQKHFNILFILLIIAVCQITINRAIAKPIYLSTGESYIINSQDEIETIFVSAAAIADYELVGKNSVIIYAKNEGVAEFILFDQNHKPITKSVVMVNNIITLATKRIQEEYPGSIIDISKIGNSYILTGTVESEEARDTIVNIVGEAIGSKENKGSDNQYINTNDYPGIVNKIKLPQSNQVNVKLTIAEVTGNDAN